MKLYNVKRIYVITCLKYTVNWVTLVCMSLATAKHVRHFLSADVNDLYPAIKLDARLSADAMVKEPRRCCTFPSTTNGTPES